MTHSINTRPWFATKFYAELLRCNDETHGFAGVLAWHQNEPASPAFAGLTRLVPMCWTSATVPMAEAQPKADMNSYTMEYTRFLSVRETNSQLVCDWADGVQNTVRGVALRLTKDPLVTGAGGLAIACNAPPPTNTTSPTGSYSATYLESVTKSTTETTSGSTSLTVTWTASSTGTVTATGSITGSQSFSATASRTDSNSSSLTASSTVTRSTYSPSPSRTHTTATPAHTHSLSHSSSPSRTPTMSPEYRTQTVTPTPIPARRRVVRRVALPGVESSKTKAARAVTDRVQAAATLAILTGGGAFSVILADPCVMPGSKLRSPFKGVAARALNVDPTTAPAALLWPLVAGAAFELADVLIVACACVAAAATVELLAAVVAHMFPLPAPPPPLVVLLHTPWSPWPMHAGCTCSSRTSQGMCSA